MKLKPMRNRVAVKATDVSTKTEGGIIIPTSVQEKATTGVVVAVGIPEYEANKLEVGDFVIFGKYAGTTLKVEGEDYIIMKVDEILSVIEK